MSKAASPRTRRIAVFIALGFGSGRLPVAPGTWGSLVGLGLAAATMPLPAAYWPIAPLAATAALYAVGVWSTRIYLATTDRKDPSEVVIDEIAGQYLASVAALYVNGGLWALALSFVLFRLFDIWKPWPIALFDRGVGAYAVMNDDIAAAAFAIVATVATLAGVAPLLAP